ncbi:MAG TPA: tetratricopeptide repeat protein [Bacteroidota bacterium]|nr:tetratricopeptide repeat protein [Bacteroidota bacterium]
MLSPKKKISKKEIKQDPLISFYDQSVSFYYENKKTIGYALTALAVLVVGIIIYTNNQRTNNAKAAAELGKVFPIYDAGENDTRQYKVAVEGAADRGIMGLRAIVDNYGSTEAGELARFYLASAYYNLGQYDDALKQYESFSNGSDLLKSSADAGIGRCYEAKQDLGKAATYFEKAAGVSKNSPMTPEYLNSAARCYGLSGEKEKAVTLLKRLKKDYPTSTFARDADRYISQFSA